MVEVPAEFVAIGYSGLFHAEATMDTMSPAEVDQWRARVPFLLGNTGWMALEVTEEPMMVVVRRDSNALWDLVTIAPLPSRDGVPAGSPSA